VEEEISTSKALYAVCIAHIKDMEERQRQKERERPVIESLDSNDQKRNE